MQRIKINRVVLFLLLTFGLTWGLEFLVALTIGQAAYLRTGLHPLGMFFPAFSALLLEVFFFKENRLYFRTHKEPTRWIFYGFFLLVFLNGILTLLSLITAMQTAILRGLSGILVMIWTLLVFYIYGKCGSSGFERVGLQLGNKALGVRFIAGIVLFLLSQAALNWLFGLGGFTGRQDSIGGVPVTTGVYPFALIAFFLISVVGTPLSSLAAMFGEEYGWRGFLHGELIKLGPRAGVFLVGLIWGIWHFPIILSGTHTYPASAYGLFLGVIFFILTGFIFGYTVMKTKSILIVSFSHGVLNSIYSFVMTYLVRPSDKVFSFGLGIYGLACLALIVLFVMRDPIWHYPTKLSR